MNNDRLLRYGFVGTLVAALCCFTPVLVILFGVIGLSTLVGWLDYILLPTLVLFAGITAFAMWRKLTA